jgi:alginate O-acetyltransferase complex protein AlgI
MLFTTLTYLIFLPIVVLANRLAPPKIRLPLLLLASYIFYAAWNPAFLTLIIGLTAFNYAMGRLIAAKRPSRLVVLAVAGNVVTLGVFKYARFAVDSINAVAAPLGAPLANDWAANIILPLGISFFVFEFIHYLVDVSEGDPPITSFVEFALFPAFFPTQIAGPIKRYQPFVEQARRRPAFQQGTAGEGVRLILSGLFKKVVIADNLAPIVAQGFRAPGLDGTLDVWLAGYCFAIQILCDFGGYTDIGRGSAMLLGYSIPENFNLPYISASFAEFWRRWHITLSEWLRDYLFFPLSFGLRSVAVALLLTMTIGGLWHGAGWTFLIWGVYQGAMLVINNWWQGIHERLTFLPSLGALGLLLKIFVTFQLVVVGWILFRAANLSDAATMIYRMFTPHGTLNVYESSDVTQFFTCAAVVIIYGLHRWLIANSDGALAAVYGRVTRSFFWPAYAATIVLILIFAPVTGVKFIYFQF